MTENEALKGKENNPQKTLVGCTVHSYLNWLANVNKKENENKSKIGNDIYL